jgi:NADH-quinone oxidoreductase subunit J
VTLRSLTLGCALALLIALVAPGLATAQPTPGQGQANARTTVVSTPQTPKKQAKQGKADSSKPEKTSKLMALVFWLFALMCIGGSVFVITRRNLIAAVMGMVGTFFAIAAVYAMLYAHFLAAIQVLVYAGAIMVLFVFVIMILNRPEDEPWSKQGVWGKAVAVIASAYLLFRLADVLWAVDAEVVGQGPGKFVDKTDFGSTAAVGKVLFQDYIFPFEAVSIVLLVAVVGAIAVARPHEKRETGGVDSEGGAA